MSPETEARDLMKGLARGRRLALLLAASVGAGALWGLRELSQEQRDRHAVQQAVWDIERKLRRHDAGMWLLPEGELPDGQKHAAGAPGHERLRDDLERLAHLENLRLGVREIRIDGDGAFADYVSEATASRAGDLKPSQSGQFSFRRAGDRWLLSGNRFDEAVPRR